MQTEELAPQRGPRVWHLKYLLLPLGGAKLAAWPAQEPFGTVINQQRSPIWEASRGSPFVDTKHNSQEAGLAGVQLGLLRPPTPRESPSEGCLCSSRLQVDSHLSLDAASHAWEESRKAALPRAAPKWR